MTTHRLQPQQLVGAWRLLACEGLSATGQRLHVYGEQPQGLLLYDPQGYMSVVLMRRGRPAFASGDPLAAADAEIKAAFEGFDAYCGTYTVDPDRGAVIHHVIACKFPNWEGTQQLRYVTLTPGGLTLTAPPILVQGIEWTIVVTWQRAP